MLQNCRVYEIDDDHFEIVLQSTSVNLIKDILTIIYIYIYQIYLTISVECF